MPDENPNPTASGKDKKQSGCLAVAALIVVVIVAFASCGGEGDKAADPSGAASESAQVETQSQAAQAAVSTAVTSSAKPAKAAGKVGQSTAAAALAVLPVKGRAPKTWYSRDQFGQAWADVDRNGCDTRNDILRRDLANKTYKPGTGDCAVASGTLSDPYTGRTIAFKRGPHSNAVQVDHVVALSNAWQTGAQQLSDDSREAFANDPLNLVAVDGPTNEAKGDGDAATWLPSGKPFRCSYVARQVAVKKKYHLWVTKPERDAISGILHSCPGQKVPSSSVIPAVRGHSGGTHAAKPRHTVPATRHPATSGATKRHTASKPTKKATHHAEPGSSTRKRPSEGKVHGGAFCTNEGAQGVTTKGTTLTCKIAKDGRLRWEK